MCQPTRLKTSSPNCMTSSSMPPPARRRSSSTLRQAQNRSHPLPTNWPSSRQTKQRNGVKSSRKQAYNRLELTTDTADFSVCILTAPEKDRKNVVQGKEWHGSLASQGSRNN